MVALLGAGVCALGVTVGLAYPDLNGVWSSLLLEIGGGVLLFAVLLWVEESVVRQTVSKVVEAFTGSASQVEDIVAGMTQDEVQEFLGPGGPNEVAWRWVHAASEGDHAALWRLMDDNLRLCRVQAWLWNNRDSISLSAGTRDDTAAQLVEGAPPDLWAAFTQSEADQYRSSVDWLSGQELGISLRRRRVGPDYEIVILLPLGQHADGFVVREPSLARNSYPLLLHRVGGEFFVASATSAPPMPGWPPTWWIIDDPALHDLDA